MSTSNDDRQISVSWAIVAILGAILAYNLWTSVQQRRVIETFEMIHAKDTRMIDTMLDTLAKIRLVVAETKTDLEECLATTQAAE